MDLRFSWPEAAPLWDMFADFSSATSVNHLGKHLRSIQGAPGLSPNPSGASRSAYWGATGLLEKKCIWRPIRTLGKKRVYMKTYLHGCDSLQDFGLSAFKVMTFLPLKKLWEMAALTFYIAINRSDLHYRMYEMVL